MHAIEVDLISSPVDSQKVKFFSNVIFETSRYTIPSQGTGDYQSNLQILKEGKDR